MKAIQEKERIRWITHKGIKILYLDYSYLDGPGMTQQVEKVVGYVQKIQEPYLRAIVDVYQTAESMQSRLAIMKAAKLLNQEGREWACIGLSPFKIAVLKIILGFTSIKARGFAEEFAAKEWLTREEA